ncbi:MAG: hypothetical protein ACQSGP_28765 [Frankia sp.]
MGSQRILHQLTLPESADPDAFETFMRDRYFPAVHYGATRIGLITDLALWRRDVTDSRPGSFLLITGFDGLASDQLPRVDDDEVSDAFTAFGAVIAFLGDYSEVVTWPDAAFPPPRAGSRGACRS